MIVQMLQVFGLLVCLVLMVAPIVIGVERVMENKLGWTDPVLWLQIAGLMLMFSVAVVSLMHIAQALFL